MSNTMHVNDKMSFKDMSGEKHGLRGHVSIYQQDPVTKKLTLWDEADNIIPISGYQWILMKMFDLFLDSKHDSSTTQDDMKQDTTIAIPDLNESGQMNIGVDPTNYTPIETNIPENHFIQGFMVGNGASSEDMITAKNTDYSFTNLRNAIPFQQTQGSLDPTIAGKYMGVYRTNSGVKSYYVKKFDETPHIVHSWWKSGQAWNYVDPVVNGDLGPNAQNGVGKTNRIESYASCTMSIDNSDFQSFFTNEGNNQSAVINELGLVAFNTEYGEQTIVENLYRKYIRKLLDFVFTNESKMWSAINSTLTIVKEGLETLLDTYSQSNISAFLSSVNALIAYRDTESDPETACNAVKDDLSSESNIHVTAYYNQNNTYIYEEDEFLTHLHEIAFNDADEAERIKLITYYTFKAIPVESNTRWVINYRIYAN